MIKFAANSAADKLNFKFSTKKAQAYEIRKLGANQTKIAAKFDKFTAQTALSPNVKFAS